MRPRLAALAAALLWLAACQRAPDLFTPSIERTPLTGAEPGRLRAFVAMSDPDAEVHLVGGVNRTLEAGAWRWASQRAELQFLVHEARPWRFVMEFTIAEATFAHTGPVTLSVSVEDKALGTLRCDTPGAKRFEHPVPAEWLPVGRPVRVAAEVDKAYVDPRDGNRLGFILQRAGFLP